MIHFDGDSVRKRGLASNGYHLPYNPNNVKYAKTLRRNMTPAEKKLWYEFLRNFKYRVLRQRPIDHYIADFYCSKLRLVIELDGLHHYLDLEQKKYDQRRTNILALYGLRILRFTNDQVLYGFVGGVQGN
jgi:very-short-patch-repair endonuclease